MFSAAFAVASIAASKAASSIGFIVGNGVHNQSSIIGVCLNATARELHQFNFIYIC